VDAEAVKEAQSNAVPQLRCDFGFIDLRHRLVGQGEDEQIDTFHHLRDTHRLEAVLPGRLETRSGPLSHENVMTAVSKVQSVRSALRTVAQHRDQATGQNGRVGIPFVVHTQRFHASRPVNIITG